MINQAVVQKKAEEEELALKKKEDLSKVTMLDIYKKMNVALTQDL